VADTYIRVYACVHERKGTLTERTFLPKTAHYKLTCAFPIVIIYLYIDRSLISISEQIACFLCIRCVFASSAYECVRYKCVSI